MAKFCEISGKVTNCTENCKVCLEEETNNREIEVGDKVRYITEDSIEDKESGYYPPKGTIGVVIGIENIYRAAPYHIQWPKGTTKLSGCWYVRREDIELV